MSCEQHTAVHSIVFEVHNDAHVDVCDMHIHTHVPFLPSTGSLSSPTSIPHGYKVSYSSMLQLPQSRFDTSSLRTEGEEGMAIRLQCIRRLGEDEILTYCTGPFYLIIKPPLHMACQSKKLTLAMKLLFLNEKGEP